MPPIKIGVMSLPVTRDLLRTEILRPGDWVIVLVLSLIPVTVVEVEKLLRLAIKGRRSKPIAI